jgi:hypothetical protein
MVDKARASRRIKPYRYRFTLIYGYRAEHIRHIVKIGHTIPDKQYTQAVCCPGWSKEEEQNTPQKKKTFHDLKDYASNIVI